MSEQILMIKEKAWQDGLIKIKSGAAPEQTGREDI